jgi:AcrR family transcriptional regulator
MPKISQAKKDSRRDQILSAAMRLFARQGFHAATMPEICAEAGLSVGAVYSYFSGKDAIITALVEAGRRGTADLTAAAPSGSSAKQLEVFLRELERPGREILDQVGVRFMAEAIGDPQLRAGYLTSYESLVATLSALAPRATSAQTSPEALGELLAAVVVGLQVLKAIVPRADVSPALDTLFALLAQHRAADGAA